MPVKLPPAVHRRNIPYLLFWPIFGLRYILLEYVFIAQEYHEVSCPLDALLPFQEVFLIPYALWYFLIVGVHLYTFFYDGVSFRRYTKFLLGAFSVSTLIFILYPTCQNLRPAVFPRENLLTEGVELLYRTDTNTNVCPSEHVIGAFGAYTAARNTASLRKPGLQLLIGTAAFLSAVATVFLKQHSVVDVLAALPVCAVFYWLCYGKA